MRKTSISVLIADDNPEISDILSNFLSLYEDIRVCGVAKNGVEALELINLLSPDVVLLDIIMPELDGISVLEHLKSAPPIKMPSIFVISAIGYEHIAQEAFSLGACYYIIKPFNLNALLRRIYAVAKNDQSELKLHSFSDNSFLNKIKKSVIELGVQTNVLGYNYIVEALVMILEGKEKLALSKTVYSAIAEKYSTNVECVERAIRSAITAAAKKRSKAFTALFESGGEPGKKCSNSEFLSTLAENIRLS